MTTKAMLRGGHYALLVLGIVLLGYVAWVAVDARLFQTSESAAFDRALQTGRSWRQPPLGPPAIHSVLGRLEIPRLHLSVMVLEGDDPRSLRLGAGHIAGTALPGETGNVAIAGHREPFFRPLRHIAKNDSIVVSTLSGAFRYRVESTEVVGPDNTAVLARTRNPVLTLVTCFPFSYIGPAPNRFVIRARLMGAG